KPSLPPPLAAPLVPTIIATLLPAFMPPIVTALFSLFEARLRLTLVASLLPAMAPRGRPLRRRFMSPRSPRLGRPAIVPHGYLEQWHGNELGRQNYPGTVVAGTHIPLAIREDVVLAAIEEVVAVD